jgi:two-component sensor histidine kinase
METRVSPKEGGGLAIAFTDVSERVRADRARELLVGELNHRVKNTLAIVQGLAQQSFKSVGGIETALGTFENRLEALARAHNLLTRDNWDTTGINDIVDAALEPYRSLKPNAFRIEGPALEIGPEIAVNFTLALNELATNALKYGALSTSDGLIEISWQMDEDELEFSWLESGGPPVKEPKRLGFGTRMIQRSLASQLGAKVDIKFEPQGLVCTIKTDPRRLSRPTG